MTANRALFLLVTRGPDAGTRLLLDETPKTVGRSRESHLVLADPNVSRSHFHVVAAAGGAKVSASPGATPLVFRDHAVDTADLAIGDAIIAGNTVLVLTDEPARDREPISRSGASGIQTLMSGVAADIGGLAAVFALNDSLSSVHERAKALEALTAWAKSHADANAVELEPEGDGPLDDGEDALEPDPVSETLAAGGTTRITVPAHGAPGGRLTFVVPPPGSRVTDSLRRLLVVAGAIFGSSFDRLRALADATTDRDSLRTLAIGSARVFSGTSSAAEEVARILPRIAASSTTVLLLGETGVGKSFVARLIHESGPRAKEALRVINCAAVPENLVESELFGHERGAFSGAIASREGVLEAAGKGTVFLDEIGELPLASQSKLLRVLEERRFERVGSNRTLPMHARVIAATNRNLSEMVAAGKFREDLFFRVSVITLRVPALRERANDLVPLAEQMLADLASTSGRRVDGFARDAIDLIHRYPWPGNVRELRNAIEHAIVLGEERLIRACDFPAPMRAASPEQQVEDPSVVRLPAPLDWLEKRAIDAALKAVDGNRTRAAALLGIKPGVLYYKLRQSGPPDGDVES